MINNRRILFIVLSIMVAGVLIFLTINSLSSTPSKVTTNIITDKDTGEKYDPKYAVKTGAPSAKISDTILFGIEPLIATVRQSELKETGGFILATKEALWKFSSDRLDNSFTSLTFRPQDTVINGNVITSTVRLGQSDTIVPITVSITKNKKTAIVSINKGQKEHGDEFVYMGGINNERNLLFTITQPDYSSTHLTITTYGGYREAALQYLIELGYSIPDLDIEFTNYENPFNET